MSNHNHTIKIFVDDAGNISYDFPSLRLKRGDTIEWVCTNEYTFTVHMGWGTPLGKGRSQTSQKGIIRETVRENALNGRYKYFVAVYDKKRDKIWTDDPELIIEP
ncbi:MAG: hypothetical protein ACE5WD_00600 [Candidatus Aminicenantia bacterium]